MPSQHTTKPKEPLATIETLGLEQVFGKPGGKNSDPRNGIYKNESGDMSFIKYPEDMQEAINEYLTGQIFQAMVTHEIIPAEDADLLITTKLIEDSDTGQIGLIQPFLSETIALHTIIGTSQFFDDDRSAMLECGSNGTKHYLTTPKQYITRLQKIVAISLLLGDYSVHSGNILLDREQGKAHKIDHGAGLRNILNQDNNSDIDFPVEYQQSPVKLGTKSYHLNYTQIPGFSTGIESIGEQIQQTMDEMGITMETLVSDALEQLPSTWLSQLEETLLALGFDDSDLSDLEDEIEDDHFDEDIDHHMSTDEKSYAIKISQTSPTLWGKKTNSFDRHSRSRGSLSPRDTFTEACGGALTQRAHLVRTFSYSRALSNNVSIHNTQTRISNSFDQLSPVKKSTLAFLTFVSLPLIIAAAVIIVTAYAASYLLQEARNAYKETTQPVPVTMRLTSG